MPPGADAFIIGFLNTILSQYGALTVFLLLVIWYLQKQVAEERRAHAATTDKLLAASERATSALVANTEALAGFRSVIERITMLSGFRLPVPPER